MSQSQKQAAYEYQRSIESKERIIVGVNEFRAEEEEPIRIHEADPELEAAQVKALSTTRSTRNMENVRSALDRLETATRRSENLMPHILAAVEAYATIGEMSDTFRKVHGEYREALTV